MKINKEKLRGLLTQQGNIILAESDFGFEVGAVVGNKILMDCGYMDFTYDSNLKYIIEIYSPNMDCNKIDDVFDFIHSEILYRRPKEIEEENYIQEELEEIGVGSEICVDTYSHGTVGGVVIEIRKKDKLEKAILGSNNIVYFDYDIEYIF